MRDDNFTHTEVFLSVRECAKLLCAPDRTVKHRCKNRKYRTRTVQGNGGERYEIALSSLPVDVQKEYWRIAANSENFQPEDQAVQAGKQHQSPERSEEACSASSAPDQDGMIYAGLDPYNRKICDRNITILTAAGDLRGEAAKNFIENIWNPQNPDNAISFKSFQRIRTDYKRLGISGICGKYGRKKGLTKIEDSWWRSFMSLYLNSQGSAFSCWDIVRGAALKTEEIENIREFPSFSLFMKRLKSNESAQMLTLARSGHDAWKKNHSYSIDVDENSISAGEVYVGDHRKLDVFVALPDGTLTRPWISAISDYKSKMILGFDIFYDNPNGDKIILCMKRAFQKGGIPSKMLFDNGKDYRRQDIGGGRKANTAELIDGLRPTITGILGIDMHYAIPYNSQSKPIERIFGIMAEYFDKHMTGYTGPDGKKRPDRTRKIETKMAAIRKNNDEKGMKNIKFPVMSFEEFEANMRLWIETYNIRQFRSGKMAGKSPLYIWNEEKPAMRGATTAELGILCASCGEPVRVNRNCLRDTRSGYEYYNPWVIKYEGSEQRFFVRVDPEHPETAYCFEAVISGYNQNNGKPEYILGKFINTASIKARPGLYKNDTALESEMEIKRQVEKEVKALKNAVGAEFTDRQKLEYQRFSAAALHQAACEEAGISTKMRNPLTGTITPFSHVPAAIEKEETNGIWNTSVLADPIKKELSEKKPTKFKRFSDIEDIEED